MKIGTRSAKLLCEHIVKEIVQWPAIDAALQSGGPEENARGRIETGIVKWLKTKTKQPQLIVLPEYKRNVKRKKRRKSKKKSKTSIKLDFSLIRPDQVGNNHLRPKALFEVKFNYAKQLTDITGRLTRDRKNARRKLDAIQQAKTYKDLVKADSAFLLYLIAAPTWAFPLPDEPRDSGWRYYQPANPAENNSEEPIVLAINKINALLGRRRRQVKWGCTRTRGNCSFYCCLIEV